MRDRTWELHQVSDSDSDSEGGEGRKLRPPADPALVQARQVGAGLRALQVKAAELEQLQETVLGTPLPPPELQRDLQRVRDEIQELTREIRGGLRGLEPPKEDEENPKSVGARVRRTQHGVLAQQFFGVTGALQESQARYRQRSLDRIRRQLLIAGSPEVSEQELEQILESGHSEIFVGSVLSSARAALDEVGERHRDLQKLERGLRELGELFQLLGSTVEAQVGLGGTGRDWEGLGGKKDGVLGVKNGKNGEKMELGWTGMDWEGLGGTGRNWEGLEGTGRNWEGKNRGVFGVKNGKNGEKMELGGTGKDWFGLGGDWDGLGGTGRGLGWTGRNWDGLGGDWEGLGGDWDGLGGTGRGLGGTGMDWEGIGMDWDGLGENWDGLGWTGRDWDGLGGD
ncbi:syntaxin-4 isoform X2 [Cinclus cinclus]|uniref:syntaxin-4 isoform X2 n=1 Tax=Cinclus cinclus TaxID=127875 RepID=UPI002E124697